MNEKLQSIESLYEIIITRKEEAPSTSYTASLLDKGVQEITKKIGEEATETIISALTEKTDSTIKESADLLYHLFVLWAKLGITPKNVLEELNNRRGVSGFSEKSSRA